MSNFSTLKELLNTTENMEVLRNNTAQDDGTDTVNGVDWFTFNGIVANKVYVNGNSWVGFGVSSEQLKICRRDAKMWYLYRQEGIIGNTRFLKIRWQGYSAYNQTSDAYALQWELFLFDDGGMYLNIVKVPSNSSYLGTSSLTVGSNTYSLAVEASKPKAFSFIPGESNTFTINNELYPLVLEHVLFGSIGYSILLSLEDALAKSLISWEEELPEGTTISVKTKSNTGEYQKCENKGEIQGISVGESLQDKEIQIKIEMSTENPLSTPVLSGLKILLWGVNDSKVLVLEFSPGNNTSIQNAIGSIGIHYSGGTLRGLGGAVSPFDMDFVPVGLVNKTNPNGVEHLEISDIVASSNLIHIYYVNSRLNEHIDISNISAVGTLTNIQDI